MAPGGRPPHSRLVALSEKVEKKLATMPPKPGVYVFRGAGGAVLYVGKAREAGKTPLLLDPTEEKVKGRLGEQCRTARLDATRRR